jgi:hypothetical protein
MRPDSALRGLKRGPTPSIDVHEAEITLVPRRKPTGWVILRGSDLRSAHLRDISDFMAGATSIRSPHPARRTKNAPSGRADEA